jgi:hypothetical protein
LQIGTEFLPNLMLIDVLREPRRYRYRLIGTHVVTASGEDRTGRMFENVGFFKVHPDGRTVDMLVVLFHFKTGPFARSLVKPRSAKKLPSGR